MQKTRQFFLKYTDLVYRAPGEELWEDLLRTKRYLELHILLYAKHEDLSDGTPLILYHAEVPEIMLEMIQQSFSSDFFIGSAKMRCVPSLALSVLTSFFFAYSQTFLFVPEKLFRDSAETMHTVSLRTFRDKLTWFDKLSLVQFFGVASNSRGCMVFFHRHLDVVYELCTLIYRGMEIVGEKLQNQEINWQNETLACFLTTFRDDEDIETTAKMFGMHTINQSVMFYKNLMNSTLLQFDLFEVIGRIVMRAEVLRHFSYLVKHIMIWFDPGLYLTTFLAAVSHTLKMAGAIQELLMENLSYTLEHKFPLGMETFKFWNHETRYPNTIAWFLLHAFCLNKKYGSDWCICILCHVIKEAEDKVVNEIVENFGLDLIDLAHVIEITSPEPTSELTIEQTTIKKISVQSIILEALLRYGRLQHKVYGFNDIIEGDSRFIIVVKPV